MMLPWKCEDCNHRLIDKLITTYTNCPNCDSENFFHGKVIDEDKDYCLSCGSEFTDENTNEEECFYDDICVNCENELRNLNRC